MTRVRLAFHCLTLALAAAAGWALNMHTTTQQLASRQPGRQQKGAAVRARAAVRNVLVMAVLQRFFGVFAGCFFKTGVTFFFGSKHLAWEVVTGLASWVQSWRQTQHYTQSLCNNHPFACFPIVCRVCFSGKQGGLFSGTSFMCQLSLTARAQN